MITILKRIAVALTLLCLFAGTSRAGIITIPISKLIGSTGYYTDILGEALKMTGGVATGNIGDSPNDDGFAGPIDLGFTLNMFGVDYTQFWANNNGLLSFGDQFGTWDPGGLSAGHVAVIAPFFADIDTTNPLSGLMHLRTDIPNEIIVTWDNVGFYRSRADKLDSFQLVLRGPDFVIPSGEGQVGFFYKQITWETADGSSFGEDGFGGFPAAIGFSDGIGTNAFLLERSASDGISGIVTDHHIWFTPDVAPDLFAAPRGATPPPVPEPTTLVFVGTGVALLGQRLLSRKRA